MTRPYPTRLALLVIIMGIATSFGVVAPAAAHHDGTELWGSNYANICDRTPASQCVANNFVHVFSISSTLSSARASASRRGFDLWGDNSVVNVYESSSTDAYVTYTNQPLLDAYAWGQCAPPGITVYWGGSEANHTRYCNPQWIYWNTWSVAANKVNSTARYNYVGCHETGHTLGLRHRASSTASCMVSAQPPSSSSSVPTLIDPLSSDYGRLDNHYTP